MTMTPGNIQSSVLTAEPMADCPEIRIASKLICRLRPDPAESGFLFLFCCSHFTDPVSATREEWWQKTGSFELCIVNAAWDAAYSAAYPV